MTLHSAVCSLTKVHGARVLRIPVEWSHVDFVLWIDTIMANLVPLESL